MRRKAGSLVPFEQKILDTATALKDKGIPEFYGFQIAKEIEGDTKRIVGYGTLYRALDRLVEMGHLTRRWEEMPAEEHRPQRRYYKLSEAKK